MLSRFKEYGAFVRDGSSVELKLNVPLPVGWGIYAFRQADEWKYVGSAQKIAARMRSYLRHQTRNSKSRAVHTALREAVDTGPVSILAFAIEPHIVDFEGLPLHVPLGVEAGLIYRLNPSWNRRGLAKTAGVEFIQENGGGAGVRLRKGRA